MSDVAEAAVALTAELVAIDSVNPGLVPGAAGEDEIVRHLRARLDAAGFTTHVVEASDGPIGPVSWPSDRDPTRIRPWSSTGTSTPSAWRG